MSSLPALAALALLLGAPRAEISVGLGASSNPFELPENPDASGSSHARPAVAMPVAAEAEVKTPAHREVRVRAQGSFHGIFFPVVEQDPGALRRSDPHGADEWSLSLSAPATWTPGTGADTHGRGSGAGAAAADVVRLTLEPFAGAHRETVTSHHTGAHYVFAGVDQAQRYSWNRLGLRADGSFARSRDYGANLGVSMAHTDYIQDYRRSPAVDSWDYDEIRADLGGYALPGELLGTASYSFRHRMYAERFPRAPDGTSILPGSPGYEAQVFEFHEIVLRGGISRRGLKAVGRLGTVRRLDLHDGYLDYTEGSLGGDLHWETRRGTLDSSVRLSRRVYDDAHINFNALEPEDARTRLTVEARYEMPLRRRPNTYLWFDASYFENASTAPLYTWLTLSASSGVRLEF